MQTTEGQTYYVKNAGDGFAEGKINPNPLMYIDSDAEIWYEANGNVVYTQRNDGTERWYYKGRLTRKTKPDGTEIMYNIIY